MISRIWQSVASRLSLAPRSKKDEIEFQSNGVLTLGVEIELQLIEKATLNLAPRADELLKATQHLKKVKPEFYLSTVEVNTDKCITVLDIEQDLQSTLTELNPLAEKLGVALSTTGVHPFAKYSDCIISPTERYQELIDRNQWLTRRMTVYGLHVHLGMASGDDCIRYNNFFMYFTPHLLALSASSPFWQGADTGLSSCRPTTYEALPTAGQPYHVRNWKEFENLYESLKKCGSINTMKDLWWDLRPSPGYGTLEIRVCDGCATLYETLAITAFIHALANWFADRGSWLESVNYPPRWLSRENKWRVIRYGLDAELVMNTNGKTKRLRDDIEEWVEKLNPYAEKLGYQIYLSNLLALLEKGVSSERQRRVFQKTGSLEALVQFNIKEFSTQKPEWD
ncbi:MAG: carboxylate--amine ligase [Rhodospirillales bacterium RIFCSPLOWO2_12_FULL_67_15]|nr:MAG: carboxylate--amine ligase [Rhodospirillales bacterium RIFCSPLOWO2_12_FULL_67_15]